jgi:molybdopterin/thiamine biosynthesis adenylyltransferase
MSDRDEALKELEQTINELKQNRQRPDFQRQAALVNQDKAAALHVTICGAGTVGSHAAVELAKLGVGSLDLFDADFVEAHNLPSQAYHLSDVGREKVAALKERVRDVSGCKVNAYEKMLSGGEEFAPGPVILAVDNMHARRAILEKSIAYRPKHQLAIDGRMAGPGLQLLCFNPTEEEKLKTWQEQFWFPPEKAQALPCGGQSVSFIGSYIGGLIASVIRNHLNEDEIPFFQQIDLSVYTQFALK